jgi:hypothetical protein
MFSPAAKARAQISEQRQSAIGISEDSKFISRSPADAIPCR